MKRTATLPARIRVEIKDYEERDSSAKCPIKYKRGKSITLHDTTFDEVVEMINSAIDQRLSGNSFDKDSLKKDIELYKIIGELVGTLKGIVYSYSSLSPSEVKIILEKKIAEFEEQINNIRK